MQQHAFYRPRSWGIVSVCQFWPVRKKQLFWVRMSCMHVQGSTGNMRDHTYKWCIVMQRQQRSWPVWALQANLPHSPLQYPSWSRWARSAEQFEGWLVYFKLTSFDMRHHHSAAIQTRVLCNRSVSCSGSSESGSRATKQERRVYLNSRWCSALGADMMVYGSQISWFVITVQAALCLCSTSLRGWPKYIMCIICASKVCVHTALRLYIWIEYLELLWRCRVSQIVRVPVTWFSTNAVYCILNEHQQRKLIAGERFSINEWGHEHLPSYLVQVNI